MWVLALALAVIALGSFWASRQRLLEAVVDAWTVSDPIAPAEAVVVLGGDPQTRAFAAAEIYRQGLVRRVLISNNGSSDGSRTAHDVAPNRRVLLSQGVPEAAIEEFGRANRNTHDEAVALRSWAMKHGTMSFVIPADRLFARRVRWVFRQEFAETGIHIAVSVVANPRDANKAWTSATEMGALGSEIIKYAYYRIRYIDDHGR